MREFQRTFSHHRACQPRNMLRPSRPNRRGANVPSASFVGSCLTNSWWIRALARPTGRECGRRWKRQSIYSTHRNMYAVKDQFQLRLTRRRSAVQRKHAAKYGSRLDGLENDREIFAGPETAAYHAFAATYAGVSSVGYGFELLSNRSPSFSQLAIRQQWDSSALSPFISGCHSVRTYNHPGRYSVIKGA